MRTETQTVRVGERMGDIDWSYDFTEGEAHYGWEPEAIERLRTLDNAFRNGTLDKWEATTDGGWPRVGWGPVYDVGMWDGGPYWKPVPSFLLGSHLGGGWHSWRMLSEIQKRRP